MAGRRYLAPSMLLEVASDGDPTTINLAQYVIDGVAVEDPPGPIPVENNSGNALTYVISVDNEAGTGDFYLAPPDILPTGAVGPDPPADPFETRPLTGLVIKAGTRDDIGPMSAANWNLVGRGLPGCSATITVTKRGSG